MAKQLKMALAKKLKKTETKIFYIKHLSNK